MRDYKKKSPLPMIVSLILSVILTIILVYICYQKGYFKLPWESSNTTTENSDTPATTYVVTGQTVRATLPIGWTMKEYYNGEGSEYLVAGTAYTGLTGLKIMNTDSTVVFSLQAISGIGFEGCSEYYQFKDDNPTYKAEMQSIANEIGDTMTVVDFSDTSYTELNVLGTQIRRIEKNLYYDETTGDSYFEASCFNPLLMLDGLYFSYEDGSKGNGYFYEYDNNATNQELLQIDSILKSMVIVTK